MILQATVGISMLVVCWLGVGRCQQTDPETRKALADQIERFFGVRHEEDARRIMEQLRNMEPQAVARDILLEIVRTARYVNPADDPLRKDHEGNRDSRRLLLSVEWLGRLKEPRLVPLAAAIATSSKYDEMMRICAVRALGNIDATGSKDVLLLVFETAESEERGLRVAAAEALAETKDWRALTLIESYARGETVPKYRKRLEAAAQKLRAKFQ